MNLFVRDQELTCSERFLRLEFQAMCFRDESRDLWVIVKKNTQLFVVKFVFHYLNLMVVSECPADEMLEMIFLEVYLYFQNLISLTLNVVDVFKERNEIRINPID